MTRLGIALGARPETFMGLSGLGDLVLTATGDLSRNRQVGLALGRGQRLAQILAQLGHVAEGVLTAPMVLARAAPLRVEMPLCEAVTQVLSGQLTPPQALEQLDDARGTQRDLTGPRCDHTAPRKPSWRQASYTATATALLRLRLRCAGRIGSRTSWVRRQSFAQRRRQAGRLAAEHQPVAARERHVVHSVACHAC